VDVISRLTRDVVATLGNAHTCLVRETLAHVGSSLAPDDPAFADAVVRDVQQRVHDEFIDTAWPRCPQHPNHPLWFCEGW
jgi:hypothetical protein